MKFAASSTVLTPLSPMNSRYAGSFMRPWINPASATVIFRKRRRSVSRIVSKLFLFTEWRDLARTAEHLVDFVEMHFFEEDNFAGVLFERDRFALRQFQKFVVGRKRRPFLFEAFAKDVADIVLMRFEQRTDLQRRMPAEHRDKLTGSTRMGQTFIAIALQPRDDRDTVISKDHQRVVRVPHDAGQLEFHDPVKNRDRVFFIYFVHIKYALTSELTLLN